MPAPERVSLVDSVNHALAQMGWLSESDSAAADLARRYALEIESASAGLDPIDTARVMKLLGPELVSVLRDLGGTPVQRKAIGVEHKVKGRLAELRDARVRDPEGLDAAAAEVDTQDE